MNLYFAYISEMTIALLCLVILPITAIGLLILRAIQKKMNVRPSMIRWTMVCVMFAVIFGTIWQAIIGTYYLRKYCEKDGGLVVHGTAQTDGIYLPIHYHDPLIDRFLARGFAFVEIDKRGGGNMRFTLSNSQQVLNEQTEELRSGYKLGYDSSIPMYKNFAVEIGLNTIYVANAQTGNYLAEYKDYYITGTWIDNILRKGFSGGLLHCSDLYIGDSRYSTSGRREIEGVLTPKDTTRESY